MINENYREAIDLLYQNLKNGMQKTKENDIEKKIQVKNLPIYYLLGECHLKMKKK